MSFRDSNVDNKNCTNRKLSIDFMTERAYND